MVSSEIRSLKRKRRLITAAFVFVTFFLAFVFLLFCKIKTVNVEGNSFTGEEEILASAKITVGAHMYSIKTRDIAERILKENPYIASVTVKRHLLSTIKISVKEDTPVFYFSFGEKFYVISENLRVLEEADSSYGLSARKLSPIILDEIEEVKIGEKIKFARKNGYKTYSEIVAALLSSPLADGITSVDISSRFNINIMYKNKYTVVYGSSDGLADKIAFSAKTAKYVEENLPGITGTIYATGSGEASFVITGTS